MLNTDLQNTNRIVPHLHCPLEPANRTSMSSQKSVPLARPAFLMSIEPRETLQSFDCPQHNIFPGFSIPRYKELDDAADVVDEAMRFDDDLDEIEDY